MGHGLVTEVGARKADRPHPRTCVHGRGRSATIGGMNAPDPAAPGAFSAPADPQR